MQAFGASAGCGSGAVAWTPYGLYSAGTGGLDTEVELFKGFQMGYLGRVGLLPICI